MQVKSIALALALTACAPTYYGVTRRCPTTTMVLGDFVLTGAAIAVAGLKWSADRYGHAAAWGAGASALWLGANYAEISCRR